MISRRQTLGLGVSAAAALVAGPAAAQTYPDRPVNLIVMAPAGGSTDVGARIVSSIAEKQFGLSLIHI